MNKYTESLNDIEMAKENGYPQRLMHKLNEREDICLKKLKDGCDTEADAEPKLSFDPDENFPCLANVLEIQSDEKFGHRIVAKCDIDIGQTVLVEETFVCAAEVLDRTLCSTCMKAVKNFIPCPNCTDAMFCDEKCMENDLIHKITCGSVCNRLSSFKIVIYSILTALNAFATVEDLMDFVAEQMASPKSDLPKHCLDARSKYAMFLKLDAKPREMKNECGTMYMSFQNMMAIPVFSARFNTPKKQRFLQHLIGQHILILKGTSVKVLHENGGVIQILNNVQSFFPASCTQNVLCDSVQNKRIGITVRPVKKGEQLLNGRPHTLFYKSTKPCEDFIKKEAKFECNCANRVSPAVRRQIKTDQLFQCIEAYYSATSDKEVSILKQKCFEFMRKYGHLHSSEESAYVLGEMVFCFHKDYPEFNEKIF